MQKPTTCRAQFEAVWWGLPPELRRTIRDFCRYHTERNSYYFVGYLAALSDAQMIADETHHYLLALSGGIEKRREVRDLVLEYEI